MRLIDTAFGKFHVFQYDTIGDVDKQGFWEPYCRAWFDRVAPGEGFVDIGANYGFFTVYMARRGCRVFSFEPSPEIFPVLKANVELNGVEGLVELHNTALFDDSCEKLVIAQEWLTWPMSRVVFTEEGGIDYDKMVNSGGLTLVPGDVPNDRLNRIFIPKRLDDYALWGEGDQAGKRIRLIKIDTQGADLRILYGARKTIEIEKPLLLFECEPIPAAFFGDNLAKMEAFMDEIGYATEILLAVGPEWRQFAARPK